MPSIAPDESQYLNLDLFCGSKSKRVSLMRRRIKSSEDLMLKLKLAMSCSNPDDPVVLLDRNGDPVSLSSSIPSGSYTMFVPPWLTCSAWAIADLNTKTLLFCKNESDQIPPASLTKLLTLFVVVNHYGESEPVMRSERVRVSLNAASVKNGTHASLLTGDVLSVFDLLYGLMLPSGNDAAIALAEHVGKRMLQSTKSLDFNRISDRDGYHQFMVRMNEICGELGLKQSHFSNPHGMKESSHLSTAEDLMQLTYLVHESPLMMSVTGTIEYEAQIGGKIHDRRIRWRNTHTLLGKNGFLSGKTGWVPNNKSGSIVHGNLWSAVSRGNITLSVLTLSSPDTTMRFVDTRILADWCFQMLLA